MDAIQDRFKEHTFRIFTRLGMNVLNFWIDATGQNKLYYVMEFKDMAQCQRLWEQFKKDIEWIQVKRNSEENGGLIVEKIDEYFMNQADFSYWEIELTGDVSSEQKGIERTVLLVRKPVSLDQLVGEIEIDLEDTFTYIDVTTGEVITLTREEIRAAEDEQPLENFPVWQRENIQRAICILEDEQEKYADFTLKNDYNEYELIEEFIRTLEDEEINEALNAAIIGKGAFRRFKDKIIEFGIDKKWYTYKENKIKELVIEWCMEHDIEFQN